MSVGLRPRKDTRKRIIKDERPALAKHFKRVSDWLEVILLIAMSPLFVFPKPGLIWLFLVFPFIWTIMWAGEKGGKRVLRSRTVIDAAVFILCIHLLLSTLSSGHILTRLPKIEGILYENLASPENCGMDRNTIAGGLNIEVRPA